MAPRVDNRTAWGLSRPTSLSFRCLTWCALTLVPLLVVGGCAGCSGGERSRRKRQGPEAQATRAAGSGVQAGTTRSSGPLAAPSERLQYIRDSEGRVLAPYTVVRAFSEHRWGQRSPPWDFLLTGAHPMTDERLGEFTFQEGGKGLPGLGRGQEALAFGCLDHLYRDSRGSRLIAGEGAWLDTLVLTARSAHPATLVKRDLSRLRTESGIGLGDSADLVLRVLGEPSARDEFGRYEILWYLGRPEWFVEPGGSRYRLGAAAAYALEEGQLVEIWLHSYEAIRRG